MLPRTCKCNTKLKFTMQEDNHPDLMVAAVMDFWKALHAVETPAKYALDLAEHTQFESGKAGINLVELLEVHFRRVNESCFLLNPATAPRADAFTGEKLDFCERDNEKLSRSMCLMAVTFETHLLRRKWGGNQDPARLLEMSLEEYTRRLTTHVSNEHQQEYTPRPRRAAQRSWSPR
jgi:hypothetical protein